jgi:hypothetical protein
VREADAERWEIVRAVKEECPIEGSFVQRSLSHSTRISRDLILQKESRDVHQIGKFQNPQDDLHFDASFWDCRKRANSAN